MRQVKLLKTMAGPAGVTQPGAIIEVSAETREALIAQQAACDPSPAELRKAGAPANARPLAEEAEAPAEETADDAAAEERETATERPRKSPKTKRGGKGKKSPAAAAAQALKDKRADSAES